MKPSDYVLRLMIKEKETELAILTKQLDVMEELEKEVEE